LSLRVVGMFVLVSVFWACWNTPVVLRTALEQLTANGYLLVGGFQVLGVLLGVVAVGVVAQLVHDRMKGIGVPLPVLTRPARQPVAYIAGLAAACLVGMPGVAAVFG